jgi:hypothetical protein
VRIWLQTSGPHRTEEEGVTLGQRGFLRLWVASDGNRGREGSAECPGDFRN